MTRENDDASVVVVRNVRKDEKMPEKYRETVTTDKLRRGDVVVSSGHVVESVAVKDKYTYVEMEGESKIGRYQHEVEFEVERERLTKEESRAYSRREALKDWDECERHDRVRLEKYVDDMSRMTAEQRFDPHLMEGYVVALEKVRLWTFVAKKSENMSLKPWMMIIGVKSYERAIELHKEAFDLLDADVPDRLDVLMQARRKVRQELLKRMRPLSKSTSVMSNVADDMKAQAHLDWLQDLDWTVGLMEEDHERVSY